MARYVSPNDLFFHAKDMMLSGKEPESDNDWKVVVAFFAVNIDQSCRFSGVKLLCSLFDCPLAEETIKDICTFYDKRLIHITDKMEKHLDNYIDHITNKPLN